jgi:8-oxo-dGTP pyrophosphatase MutT (NUDIX family)
MGGMAGPVLDEVPALPAASAIVLRDGPLEVLMLQRHAGASFMPNVWVFPGGMTEPDDRELATIDLDVMKITAIRETFEESGVWLGGNLEEVERVRVQLHAGELTFRELLAASPVSLDQLVYTSRWITPVGVPKRFDTWFFLAHVARDAVASAELRETTAVQWIRPGEALAKHAAKEMQMVFPTLRNLEALVGFESAQALMDSRRGAVIEPVLPVLVNGKPALR